MPVEKTKSISDTRKSLNAKFDKPGIHPVSVRGKFAGVILSLGEDTREKTAKRLEESLKRNEEATILEILDLIEQSETD
ncbi:hypothetical protein [Gracilimonas sediminicola]|uniref:hypothetical protein n=1 Tax=Gracilimonas sediminicola TaxID=2952158 RepID=UPI0038D451FA